MKQARHELTASDYNDATQDYTQNWETVDQTLYRLCNDHPLHTDRLSVTAKVVIIGRSYATGIERKVSTTGAPGSSISQVVALFCSNDQPIDQWLDALGQLSEPLTTSAIPEILKAHGLILNLLRGLTIDSQSARSFVSKYLHFYNRVVPIYDSITAGFLPKLVRIREVQVPTVDHADGTYAEYVYRFAKLYDAATSQGIAVTVRLLDYYLIWKKQNSQAAMSAVQTQLP